MVTLVITGNYRVPRLLADLIQIESRQPYLLIPAVQDLYAHDINGVLYFFRGIPKEWKRSSFTNLHLPGGVIASGEYCKGKTTALTLKSTRETTVRYKLPDHTVLYEITLKKGEAEVLHY